MHRRETKENEGPHLQQDDHVDSSSKTEQDTNDEHDGGRGTRADRTFTEHAETVQYSS